MGMVLVKMILKWEIILFIYDVSVEAYMVK